MVCPARTSRVSLPPTLSRNTARAMAGQDNLRLPMKVNAELSADFLEHLIDELGEPLDNSPRSLLEEADLHEMKVLLASAWQAEGIEISPPIAYEVEMFRTRFENHRKLFNELSNDVEGLRVVKGYEVADLYPQGWVRGGKDLDVQAVDQSTVWTASRWLMDRGWSCASVFLQEIEGVDTVIIVLKSEPLDAMFMRPETIEVGSVAFVGNFYGLAPRLASSFGDRLKGNLLHIVGILEQRLERLLVARDVVDAIVLLREIDESELRTLWEVIDSLDFWKEWNQLAYVLDYLELVPNDVLSPANRKPQQRASTLRRRRRAATQALKPTTLARGFLHEVSARHFDGQLARRTASELPKVVSAVSMYRAGLPLVGVPVSLEPGAEAVTTEVVNGRLVVRCPLGIYMAIAGSYFEPEWVTEIQKELGLE